jgi:phage repressor protein C with HTH and peptisase S24 domain
MTYNKWFTAEYLKGLPGLPKAASSISRRATKEGWEKRQKSGVKGVTYEYHMSSLPDETRKALAAIDNETPLSQFKVSESGGGFDYSGEAKLKAEINKLAETIFKNIKGLSIGDAEDLANCFTLSNLANSTINNLIYKLKNASQDISDDFALIPGYRVQVSAGNGSMGTDSTEPVRHLAFRKKWLQFKGFNPSDLAVVWAKGDSMHPTISDNDTLVVHLGRTKPKDGYIYVFRNGDELFVKRYQNALGSWRLISDNSLYAPLDVKKEDQHQFEAIGQVVHVAKDIAD